MKSLVVIMIIIALVISPVEMAQKKKIVRKDPCMADPSIPACQFRIATGDNARSGIGGTAKDFGQAGRGFGK